MIGHSVISDPTAVFMYLAGLLGAIFWLSGLPQLQRLFHVTPAIIYAYFLPALSTSLGITPDSSTAYDWMLRYLLPVSLLLLMVTVDVRAIIRLGGKALIMMLAGSLGIIIGGPVALALLGHFLPPDTWMGLAALSGSWIGGAPNMVAIKESVGTPDSLMGPIIVVDTFFAYGWMGVLLFLGGFQDRLDRWLRADTEDLDALDGRLAVEDAVRNPVEIRGLAMILGLGFAGGAACIWLGDRLPLLGDPTIVSHTTWTVVLVTSLGLALSFTPVRRLERVGASRAGYIALYLMLTAIGAQADLKEVIEVPLYLVVGVIWLGIHIAVLFVVGRLVRAPLFFVATGSMANVGGVVSAPIVASVYRRSLAPVGVLMGVSGYLIGIYGALLCAWLLSVVASAMGFIS
ncbi:MAG: DUF819 family protein [Acidobacteria bacterium]|jgi:uncharacterized membrane protein|nr:DUF819 family protein [Acidobacteriota bacterium]